MNSADQGQISVSCDRGLSNLVHHRAGQVAAEVGSLTFLATWGGAVQNQDIPTEVLAKHYVAIGVSVPQSVPECWLDAAK